MPTVFDQIIDLKTKAKNRRDMGKWERAAAFVNEAISLANSLAIPELRSRIASELADCYGLLGGIERRWALASKTSGEHDDHIRKSVHAYDEAWRFESGDYGLSSSYGMVNRLVSRIMADPDSLAPEHVTNLGKDIQALKVRTELEKTKESIEISHRTDYWSAADLALIKLLLGEGDPAVTYAAFNEKSPPDYAYNSVLDVLKPLSTSSLPVKNGLVEAVKLLEARLALLRSD